MLSTGTSAPEFTLPGTAGGHDETEVTRHDLSEALQHGPVLINFYLFDFHPKCTENLCELHDLAWFDLDESVTVFGISSDRSFSHRAFADTEELAFTLLSDSDGSVAEAYDVFYEEFNGHKRIAKRSVFLVDPDRTVRYAWSTDDPTVQPDWSSVKQMLDELKSARQTS